MGAATALPPADRRGRAGTTDGGQGADQPDPIPLTTRDQFSQHAGNVRRIVGVVVEGHHPVDDDAGREPVDVRADAGVVVPAVHDQERDRTLPLEVGTAAAVGADPSPKPADAMVREPVPGGLAVVQPGRRRSDHPVERVEGVHPAAPSGRGSATRTSCRARNSCRPRPRRPAVLGVRPPR